jgi:DNA-binding LacI/PurR family transcriptional regulator
VALGVAEALPAAGPRLRGYLDARAERGLTPLKRFRVSATIWTRPARAAGIDRALDAAGPPPDAVFAFNDTLALGAMRAVLRRGLRIPPDVAIVGIDDVAEAEFRCALELLDEQITAGTGGRPHREVVTGYRLAARESTLGA